jgi:hypothetical protein
VPRGGNNNQFEYKFKDERQIRNFARDLRKKLEIDHRYSPDLYEILHRLHKVLPKFKLKEVEDADLPFAEAKAHCESGILQVTKSTLVALDKYGDPRARWTAAHEIGHIVLGHTGRRFRKRPNEPITDKEKQFETEADVFASEFLSPTHLAIEYSTAAEISRRFQLSVDASARRVDELEKTRSELKQELRTGRDKTIPEASSRPSLAAQLPAVITASAVKRRAFAAMEYTDKFNRLYVEILKPTVEDAGLWCLRADEIYGAGAIADDIQFAIKTSQIVIAEISGFNPNVMHEIGLAQSLGKPTVILCQDSYRENEIPSNIRHIRRIMYGNDVGSGPLLKRRLLETLETIVPYLS